MRVKKGDEVVVLAGKDKGKRGRVLKVLEHGRKLTVEKLNIVKRHTKKTEKNPTGGIQDKEAPLDISNVMLWSVKLGRPVRVNCKMVERTGKTVKVRYSHKFNEALD
jgi:large subunit ribosomal protein L24